jgi:hypothetical protein
LQALEDRAVPATITVTTIADNTTVDGKVSLREALTSINGGSNANGDVVPVGSYGTNDAIVFSATLFGSAQTITLNSVLPDISKNVSFQGTTAANVTITYTAGTFRMFNCAVAGTGTISFSNITITGGNVTAGGNGAGIFASDDNVTITNCVISNNSTNSSGGGIANLTGGTITLINCTISGNSATRGGGIYCFNTGALVMDNCTVSGNSASDVQGGGGVFNNANVATIRNSTISGNHATNGAGGGITSQGSATVTIQNSTIAFNDAKTNGGGINRTAGTVSFESTIVAKNTAQTTGDDVNGTFSFAKFNLIGEIDGSTGITDPSNKTGTKASPLDPLLGALANNGGPTLTHALLPGSPCVNAGSNPAAKTNDQRGSPILRVSGGQADIGAFETSLVVASAADSGANTLRQAVLAANFQPGADTITFDATFFSTPQTITLTSGEIAVSDVVTITGPGAAVATVSGNNASRVFEFKSTGANSIVSGLTLTKGNTGSFGGGVYSSGNLTIQQCVISGNTSTAGGGVFVYATLTLTDSQVTNNSAGLFFGGVYGLNGTIIQRSTISGNMTSGSTGGLFIARGFTMTDSTVSNNFAQGIAGGINLVDSIGATNIIRNCTISGNTAGQSGGGIALGYGVYSPFNSVLTVQNCTITANTATSGSGGGIARVVGSCTVSIESGIVSGNVNSAAPDIFGQTSTTVTAKNSAIGSFLGLSSFVDQGGNLPFGTNLKLGPLANNGGPMMTHLPAPDSPLVNAGSNPAGLTNDQRGVGYGRSRSGGLDIGAVEAPTNFVVTNANDSGAGSLRQAVLDANSFAGADTITFDPTFFNVSETITLITGELLVTESVNIIGPGPALATVSGNNAGRVFNLGGPSGTNVALSGLTITKGSTNAGGAGINNADNLVVSNCVITANNGTGGSGGGIFSAGANSSLTLTESQITNNTASIFGGIVDNSGATIQRCTISGNTAGAVGGMQVYTSLLMTDSTVSNNSSTSNFAGGIRIAQMPLGSAIIRNCTISGNSTVASGGGISVDLNVAAVIIQNSTITNNSAGTAGGGIVRTTGSVIIQMESDIVSGNICAASPDISGVVAAKNCAIGSATGITTFFSQGGNLAYGTNLQLGPLANNGGPTLTHLPASDSPLVNAGSNPAALPNDQRGAGFARSMNGGVDIGAIEAFILDTTPPLVSSITPSVPTVSDAQLGFQGFSLTVNFNEPMDQTTIPSISFPIENPAGTLAFDTASWLNSTQFRAKYDVEDLNTSLNAIHVRVTGGKDLAGNVMATSDNANVFSIDTKNPVVASIVLNNPMLNNLSTVGWTVTFTKPVTGVAAGNFTLFNGGLGGAPVVNSVTGGGTTWIVTATGYAGQGTLALYVTGSFGVTDAAGNPLAALPAIGPAYSIDPIPPSIFNIQVNDGSVQRSRVTSITVTFIELVSLPTPPANAFTLTGPNGPVTLAVDTSGSTSIQTVAKLTFSSATTTDFTSLKDGRYTLKVLAAQVTDLAGNPLDGNGDGTGGDDFVEVGAPGTGHNLFRFYGDINGDGTVSASDFIAFRQFFGGSSFAFDFDNDGAVAASDFIQFRRRFGGSI